MITNITPTILKTLTVENTLNAAIQDNIIIHSSVEDATYDIGASLTQSNNEIHTELDATAITLSADIDKPSVSTYEGIVNVTPSSSRQTLSTAGMIINTNIVVEPIPSNYGRITWNGSTMSIT